MLHAGAGLVALIYDHILTLPSGKLCTLSTIGTGTITDGL